MHAHLAVKHSFKFVIYVMGGGGGYGAEAAPQNDIMPNYPWSGAENHDKD